MLQELKSKIDNELSEIFSRYPAMHEFDDVLKAHSYPVEVGGKRVRPLIARLMAGSIAGEQGVLFAREASLALELIHTYSLVHDDLPCMDNDDLRRGKPTTHKIYGDAKALLVGDGLLTLAFEVLADSFKSKDSSVSALLVTLVARAAGMGGMVGGQWLDMSATNSSAVSWNQLESIHRNKTGKLLGASVALGYACGKAALKQSASEIELQVAHALGEDLGLAFQIIDDILDVTAPQEKLGKTAGKDLEQNKATAVKLLGLEAAQKRAAELTLQSQQKLQRLMQSFATAETKTWESALSDFLKSLLERRS